MDTGIKNIFHTATYIRLTPAEKARMRADVALFVEKHPVRNIAIARQLIQERSNSDGSTYAEMSVLQSLLNRLQPMFIALIIAVMVGGGTSLAAEKALPGDVLYPIKVGINEEVGSFLAFSEEAQARFDARRAENRLEEAEKLAATGRLSAEARADIESRFESHAQAFEESAQEIEAKQNNRSSIEMHSDFEASLNAHEEVLTQLAAQKETVRIVIEPLLLSVRRRLETTGRSRGSAEARVSAEIGGEFKAAAQGKMGATENKIREVRGFIEKKKASVNTDAYAGAEARLNAAADVVARGKTEMEAETYARAFVSFEEAFRIAQEVQILIATEDRIDIKIEVPGIDLTIGSGAVEGEAQAENKMETEATQGTSSEASVKVKSEMRLESGNDSTETSGEGEIKIDVGL